MQIVKLTVTLVAASLSAAAAAARDQVQIAGSSTVLPYATIVAEAFGENLDFPTPVVESGGSSAGLKRFCEGVGENTIDIANSSRQIRETELAECAANGVTGIVEVRIGYDGIVFASGIAGNAFAFTPEHWYRALAAEVVVDGQVVANPYTMWNQIDPALPAQEIQAFVPGTKHGTREVFDQKVILAGCEASGALEALTAAKGDEDKAEEACVALRTDGRSVDIDGDYTETLARIEANPRGIGVFGLSFYENNTDKLQVATISGVVPSTETISTGEYPVSRPLYFYIKKAHLGVIPGLQEFVEFFVLDEIAGPDGPLAGYGLVADPELSATQAKVGAAQTMQSPEQARLRPGRPLTDGRAMPQMPVFWTFLTILAIAAIGFAAGRGRAFRASGGDIRTLHSRPGYYGWHAALFAAAPAILTLAAWLVIAPAMIERQVSAMIPESLAASAAERGLLMADVRRTAAGLDRAVAQGAIGADEALGLDAGAVRERLAEVGIAVGQAVGPEVLAAAQRYRALAATSRLWMTGAVIGLALIGAAYAVRRTAPGFRARNAVERAILGLLILCASIAILTTLGIVLSMLFEARNFFAQYDWTRFFFNTTWSPQFRGNSELGIIPLLWGTLYVSLIALLVAVPVGLYAAIYMSEYAGRRLRAVAKPMIEVLAGIPTIVYGLFALITVGPLLRDWFAAPLGLGQSSSSVMTAGLVMGIMLIPFVSSLSDDIINAVPQAMRDGSLGLGATHSETIRQVVLPAALPGIVGAVLLAASRAIGETMIVVLGAGAAAKLDLNPFEAMTTVTVKIVSQLTGDTDFASPETLVAFALGLTLFVITLALNVLALWIVRRYREQYE